MFKLLLHWMLMAQQCPGGAECVPIHPPCDVGIALHTFTEATIPLNRARVKLGVGERTTLSMIPTPDCPVAWSLTGSGTLSQYSGASTTFIAHDRASIATVTATINGVPFPVVYTVVEPADVLMTRAPNTGIRHAIGTASTGFIGHAYITPEDVSFKNIQVREGTVNGVGTGILAFKHGEVHVNGGFFNVVQGDMQHPSRWDAIDAIATGFYPPPWTGGGTFTWPIPWLFTAGPSGEKQFTTMTHLEQVDSAGRATMSKSGVSVGGASVSSNASDPTSNF